MSAAFFLFSGLILVAVFSALWWHQHMTKNAALVDAAWALAIGVQTAALAYVSPGDPARRAVIAGMVGFWSLRLAGHLILDRVLSGVEDGRYARFRKEWSPGAFYLFYLAQAALAFLLPLTFLAAFQGTRPFPSGTDILGLSLWFFALAGETIADRQLARFRADPNNRGRTCRQGLWRYSRHPNYFFEWLIWCAYLPLAWGSSLFLLALLGPALLLFLLINVSGIPPTEAQALSSRGEDYRAYQRTTSAFFPWFPKKEETL